MAPERRYIARFSLTERMLHWVHATAFLTMLTSGLILYLPILAERIGRRPLVKDVHVYTAVAWIVAIGAVVAVGDRRALREALRELDSFDADDRRWLCMRNAPQGRFNAGQKLNAALTAAFAALFAASGFLLWYGERNTRFRLGSAVILHDALTYLSLLLLVGHLYVAVIHPRTRHALRGITRGTVEEQWALEHHSKWAAPPVSRREHDRS
jgi:formate dehydrogenase subunit gamma